MWLEHLLSGEHLEEAAALMGRPLPQGSRQEAEAGRKVRPVASSRRGAAMKIIDILVRKEDTQENRARESEEGRTGDAWALRGEEGRDKLR